MKMSPHSNEDLRAWADADNNFSRIVRELAAELLELRGALSIVDTDDGSVPEYKLGARVRAVMHGRSRGCGDVVGIANGFVRVLLDETGECSWWCTEYLGPGDAQ